MNWVEKIAMIKNETGFTAKEIAKLTNENGAFLSRLENGLSRNPKTAFIQALIVNLHVNPYWLFMDEGDVLARNHQADIPYDAIRLYKDISFYDAMEMIRNVAVDNQSGPPGIEKTPNQHANTNQGSNGRL